MLKKTSLIVMLALLASGCTREVYLQEVPCTDCQPEPVIEEPCQELTPTCCPEMAMQTQFQVYQVYEVPVVPVVYQPCCTMVPVSNCSTCHTAYSY